MSGERSRLIDEILKEQKRAFFDDLGSDWEKTIDECYKEIRQHILWRVKNREKKIEVDLFDVTSDKNFRLKYTFSGNNMKKLLLQKLWDEGLDVKPYQTSEGLALKIMIPELPDNLNFDKFEHQ